jgi:hypothetical protein
MGRNLAPLGAKFLYFALFASWREIISRKGAKPAKKDLSATRSGHLPVSIELRYFLRHFSINYAAPVTKSK